MYAFLDENRTGELRYFCIIFDSKDRVSRWLFFSNLRLIPQAGKKPPRQVFQEIAETRIVVGNTTEKEIIQLFGKPTEISDTKREAESKHVKSYKYVFFRGDEYFFVLFDSNGIVTEWYFWSGY